MAFTEESRRSVLAEYSRLYMEIESLSYAQTVGSGKMAQAELDSRQGRLSELWKVYEAGVPGVPLSRCPFTGEVLVYPFDPCGLDGLWWSYEAPIRPFQPPPPTFMALTGAVRLNLPVEKAPFLVVPGPGVPFVYPRLLTEGSMQAVIYSLPVGRHTAFPMVYFALEMPKGIRMPNLWGASTYQFRTKEGELGWYESFDSPEDWDFQLRKWIDRGKLLWIAPDDPDMTLHSTAAGCPYIGLPGERQEQRLYAGTVEVGMPESNEEA
ncbi:MAG: hypothetical protein NTY38_11780 [Acidobacteria bacterium]|nr:hypothetical protein [Acidobacteriota bacterium]